MQVGGPSTDIYDTYHTYSVNTTPEGLHVTGLEPANGLEVQVHHLINLGGWNDVKSVHLSQASCDTKNSLLSRLQGRCGRPFTEVGFQKVCRFG
jgi:hypothetical protein